MGGHGHISEVEIKSSAKDCFAFVTFVKEREGIAAMEALDQTFFANNRVMIRRANTRNTDAKDNVAHTIWVGGLPAHVTERDVEKFCRGYGDIHNVNIKYGRVDTFAFVTFSSQRLAEKCMTDLNQTAWFNEKDRLIKVGPVTAAKEEEQPKGKWRSRSRSR